MLLPDLKGSPNMLWRDHSFVTELLTLQGESKNFE
jgi:hypothetical protein